MDANEPTKTDACGAEFSQDGQILIRFPQDFVGEYAVPEGVIKITEGAFRECKWLTSVKLPQSLSCIGDGAFADCHSLLSVNIPSGVAEIGPGTFYDCQSIKEVKLHSGRLQIYSQAFILCHELERVIMPDSCEYQDDSFHPNTEIVPELGELARLTSTSPDHYVQFSRDGRDFQINSDGAILSADGKKFWYMPLRFSGDYVIPAGAETIAQKAFNGCCNLSSVRLPSGLVRIEFGAFDGCPKLTRVVVPDDCEVDSCAFDATTAVIRRSDEDARLKAEQVARVAALLEKADQSVIPVGLPLPKA